jgi:NADP-dependent aldehyde dehydrogenase
MTNATDRITKIGLSSVILPLQHAISDAKVLTGRQRPMTEVVLLFAEIKTHNGFDGLGFSYSKRAGGPAQFAHAREIAPRTARAKTPTTSPAVDQTGLGRRVGRPQRSRHPGHRRDGRRLWDLKAKRANLPLAKLLGAHREFRALLRHLRRIPPRSPSTQVLDNATASIASGIGGIKIKSGIPRPPSTWPASGPSANTSATTCPLMVDAKPAMGRGRAQRAGRALEEFDLVWIEEPLDAYDAEGHAALAQSLDTPIASGEMLTSVGEHQELIRHHAVDVIQPDAPRIGGITQFLRLAALAEQHHLTLAPHFAMEIHAHLGRRLPARTLGGTLRLAPSAVQRTPQHQRRPHPPLTPSRPRREHQRTGPRVDRTGGHCGQHQSASRPVTAVPSIDPRTGDTIESVGTETTTAQVDQLSRLALTAAGPLEAMGRLGRAALLERLAAALEAEEDQIVAVADRETGLGPARFTGELKRTAFQLRLFAGVLRDGAYLEATIDHAADTPMGPRPDLRRMLVPIGPVAVFGASNFPLAFSVPGGDTASALAAGCPVIVKAHPSHPATSRLCFELLDAAARSAEAPEGTLGIVHGQQAGADLVAHPAIRAIGFTGSTAGARALMTIIDARPDPIPFYGELSSLNPVIITPAAVRDRAAQIGTELVGSFTLGAGQFCTKPGLVFIPTGPAGDETVAAMQTAVSSTTATVMLNASIATAYEQRSVALALNPDITTVANGQFADAAGSHGTPLLLGTTAAELPTVAFEEYFGPVAIIARYDDEADLFAAVDRLPPSLTATIHRGPDETALPADLTGRLLPRVGRIVYDGYPTGVAVAWAQHHGGPWPATNTQHTSVGTTAIHRFLRPVAWQNAPTELLPAELRDGRRGHPPPR